MINPKNLKPGEDIYRMLLQNPPDESDPAAHLVWLRLISRPMKELADVAPLGAIALSAHPEGLKLIGDFGRGLHYENAMAEGKHLGRALLSYLRECDSATHIVDIIRTEAWLTVAGADNQDRAEWESCVGLRELGGRTFLTVSHNTLSSLQILIAWQETTLGRCGHLLWLQGIAPVRPMLDPSTEPGIIRFGTEGSHVGAVFLAVRK